MNEGLPSAKELQKLIAYNPKTGHMSWKVTITEFGIKCGDGMKVQGSKRQVILWSKTVLPGRLAWALHHGAWPTGLIMTRNGNNHDVRICNLYMTGAPYYP